MSSQPDIRSVLLEVIDEQKPRPPFNTTLQSKVVLPEAAKRLGFQHDREKEEAILTQFHELFRTGYLAWGFNLSNPDAPFFHLTEQGQRTLAQLSHDPGNPAGYLRHVYSNTAVNPIARSYLEEGVHCYVGALYKAGAVMVGAAAESIILELRDDVTRKLNTLGQQLPSRLDAKEWRMKNMMDGLKVFFDGQRNNIPNPLRDAYEGYWPAFTQQIRAARYQAGHPSDLNPITPETLHGSLLIFPELLKLADTLRKWVSNGYS